MTDDLPILYEKPPGDNYTGTDELILARCEGEAWMARVYIDVFTHETIFAKIPEIEMRPE